MESETALVQNETNFDTITHRSKILNER